MSTPESPFASSSRESSIGGNQTFADRSQSIAQILWKWTALIFLSLGWGLPLLLFVIGYCADRYGLQGLDTAIRSAVQFALRETSFGMGLSPLPLVLPVAGLVGLLMLLVTTSFFRRQRRFRLAFLLTGVTTAIPILVMALSVDKQPPGSGLAMIISLFAIFLGPLLIGGVSLGIIGLMMYLPTSVKQK